MIAIGNFLFHFRNVLFPCALLLVLLPGPRLFPDSVIALMVGALFATLGQAIRALTIGLKYVIRGGRNRRVYAEKLVKEGLFAHTRNPMYIGNLLILFGVAIASNSWACLLIAVPLFVFVYACIVAAEEDFLRRKFGAEFESYARAVPRWGARLRGISHTIRSAHFSWRRLLVKEYGTPFAWVGGLCLLGLWRLHQSAALAAVHPHIRTALLAVLSVALVFWCTALWVKRRRIIVAD